jgi:hypothetical protein
MSALSEAQGQFAIPVDTIVGIIAPIIYDWMDAHANDVVMHYRGRIIGIPWSVSISVDKLRPFVARLIGPDPRGRVPQIP